MGERLSLPDEKAQVAKRLSAPYLGSILSAFNAGDMDSATAMERLQVGRSRLYQLRTQWLANRRDLVPICSGGSRVQPWPAVVMAYLRDFLPHCTPQNFSLVADELDRRFGFVRSRAAVADACRRHFPLLVPSLPRGPRPRRRWETAAIGELFQHDSSPHRWWLADSLQSLILTIDDHSRKMLGGLFVPADTTWDHFVLLRAIFLSHGLPAAFYTDGLSLFGHTSTADRLDTHSQFQRALTSLGSAHRVAPDAQAKGKIERRFGYFQKRLVSVFAHESVTCYQHANLLLAEQIDHHNRTHRCRTTGMTPNQAWEKARIEQRVHLAPPPVPALLDLHLSLQLQRRVGSDSTIDFLGRNYPIAPTQRKSVTIVHHPRSRFWVIPHPPLPANPVWPEILAAYSL